MCVHATRAHEKTEGNVIRDVLASRSMSRRPDSKSRMVSVPPGTKLVLS